MEYRAFSFENKYRQKMNKKFSKSKDKPYFVVIK